MELVPILSPIVGTFLLALGCVSCGMCRLGARQRALEERLAILESQPPRVVVSAPATSAAPVWRPAYVPAPVYYQPPAPSAPPSAPKYV